MRKDHTAIVFLLDRSGSMSSIKKDIIGGFNNLIGDQKKVAGTCSITLAQFDNGPASKDGYLVTYDNVDISLITPLTEKTYIPRDSTAIYDSASKLIDDTGKKFSQMSEDQRPERVLFVFMTDGESNSDLKETKESVFNRVKHQTDNYKWEFMFIGANQDTFTEAASLGISRGNTISFNSNNISTHNVYMATSNLMRGKRSVDSSLMASTSYSDKDRDDVNV